MTYQSPDLTTAPRLENDVYEFYREVHFSKPAEGVKYEEHLKQIVNKWESIFLAYINDWNFLLQLRLRGYEFSFWLNCFHKAYLHTLVQAKLSDIFFQPSKSHNEQWLIQNILRILRNLFETTGFHEHMNQQNERYEKRIDAIREAYCATSELSVGAMDLKFYLSYLEGSEQIYNIDELTKAFRTFEKRLKQQLWYGSQVMFTFYHVVRNIRANRYVIRFYLTIHKTFYSEQMNYTAWIAQLWSEETARLGILLDTFQMENHASSEFIINDVSNDEIFNWVEPNDPLENLDHLPKAVTSTSMQMEKLCVYPIGFKSFHGKKGSFFN
ncbi:hypothetical protein R4483_07405 [Acinetobacter baumannii]|uniref:hypothetical protein n=1 Tax=Acinetobacter calcoaceticus/baumannii complex TaxID=909768 RepID=UPI00083977B9|nr:MULTISPECIES: hypothetical protein [Acinetobacter calcoaceticus/baumannii complex]MDH2526539.1 hypothetical protein [Acinetobacter baumannii]MDV7432890.1 hypothetical protein [Acinetobacter baumannii]MDV8152262.1 hypothetical protein [Acinetobacter pittii]OCY52362.1 hypothetical protein BFR81_08895 [Acinetobacter pittii]HCW3749041.1 hypothetical protein [Acinetobacter baumannii]